MFGRQGRVLFAYLVMRRLQLSSRDELVEVLWSEAAPPAADASLSAFLSKLRGALGPGVLEGKRELRLVLPPGAWVDAEAAFDAIHRAESSVALGDWASAWAPARIALNVANRPFLPGAVAPWADNQRRAFDDLRLRALECVAAAGLGLGGPELAATERSARSLIEAASFRESGYRFLIEALAARDEAAEALVVYERLRRLLRDELGIAPTRAAQELHRAVLMRLGERVGPWRRPSAWVR